MQNPYVKFLKTKNTFFLFYYEQGHIFCRQYIDELWTPPQSIAEKTAPFFSLCQYQDTAYLLYTGTDGQLIMASTSDYIHWEHRNMPSSFPTGKDTKFFLLPTENTFHLIYHQPTESTGVDALVYTVYQNGKWEKPYQIDRFLPMAKTPFLARRLSKEHIILYYRTGRNILSAREMLLEPHTMGSVTPLIQTPASFHDISVVNDNEKIHLLYIVRGMFRTQVVYQYKHTSAISTPRIIWEDNNCDNCLVYLENGKVILMWTVNGHPMRCISETGGASFGATEKYTFPFPEKCMRAELIGAEQALCNTAEWYCDNKNGFLPTILPLYSPSAQPKRLSHPTAHTQQKKTSIAVHESHRQQLEELHVLLMQRSDEIAAVNAKWKAQAEKLESELAALRKENNLLKTQIDTNKKDT